MKKNLFIQLLAISLAAICSLSLISCSKGLFDGTDCSEDELRVVGNIGNYEVRYDELYYLVMTCKEIMEAKYGAGIWKNEASALPYADELKSMVMERITANYAVLLLCEEYGLNAPLENKEIIESVYDETENILYSFATQNGISVSLDESLSGELTYKYEKGGRKKALALYKDALKYSFLNERVMRLTLASEFAFEKLITILTGEKNEIIYSDSDIEQFMMSDEFICTRHIFVEGLGSESRARAEEALALLKSGTPIENLIAGKYNDDVTAPAAGYYFTYGEMDEAYESAAFALDVGDFSEIVEADNGFYIIERHEKSNTYMLANIAVYTQQIIYAQVNVKVASKQSELSLSLNDFGKSLDFYKIGA